jgi:tetratricopeptide (TPR) repeat protein
VLEALSADDSELRSLAFIRLASLERHAGHLKSALAYLEQAGALVESSGPWVSGRRLLELASTYKDVAISDELPACHQKAEEFYRQAFHEFEAVGNHRLCAIVENNLGVLLLLTHRVTEAEFRLLKARRVFEHLDDHIRCAQADDSLARLYFEQGRLTEARTAIERSIQTMETGDEDALLAESLTTKGVIYCALKRYNEAQKALDGAFRLASRCGDTEGAGRSLLVMVEEMASMLEREEMGRARTRLLELLSTSEQTSIRTRATNCIHIIDSLLECRDP